ncbi:MAG TPA: NAD(P)-dependent oxidoreductase, partial [Steroidobacteraceae bacterium]|nr:NAD(P)-dependent oxidoreductase [Steroidobacteraceae bacterium]
MKVLITGAGGQLGQELLRTAPADAVVTALGSTDCDIGDADSVARAVARHDPQVIINAAGYTAVDKAESEPAAADRVNALGPAHLAAAAGRARLLHVSTDFVFDGAQGRPWRTDDRTNPLSAYGRSKLAGESPVLALGNRGVVLRTSWVYSRFGGNFVKTMLRLMSSRPEVRVVSDQVGAPTWARGL